MIIACKYIIIVLRIILRKSILIHIPMSVKFYPFYNDKRDYMAGTLLAKTQRTFYSSIYKELGIAKLFVHEIGSVELYKKKSVFPLFRY